MIAGRRSRPFPAQPFPFDRCVISPRRQSFARKASDSIKVQWLGLMVPSNDPEDTPVSAAA